MADRLGAHSARPNSVTLRALYLTVSAAALVCGGAAFAQDTAQGNPTGTEQVPTPQAQPTVPSTNTVPGTISGTPDQDAAAQAAPDNPPVSASNAPDAGGSEIVVTGIRASLASAQSLKRNADTVVDAITAEDIGALPDRSINEALQRVPGVTITRFAAPNDSAHFSVEGSGVQIRGLTYNRSEFNGRDTFAPSGGRGIGFNDVPVELAGSVEVFKNLTPDLVEGGIAGTVNINTRKPFDSKDQIVYLSGAVSYGDMAQRSAPSITGLYSNQWELGDGSRVGALIGGSYFQQYSRADSAYLSGVLPRFNAPDDGVDGYAPDGVNYEGSQYDGILCDGNNPNEGRIINGGTQYATRVCDQFPIPNGLDTVYTPSGAGVSQQIFNNKRTSITGGLQYESADRSLLVTGQYLRAESTSDWLEHRMESSVWYGDIGNTFPAGYINQAGFPYDPNANYTFDENGVFTSGVIARRGNSIAHNTPAPSCGAPDDGDPTTNSYCSYPNFVNLGGINTSIGNRHFYQKTMTQDASLNVKWEPTDRLHLNFDGQYVNAKAKNVDDTVDFVTYADTSIDLTGKNPKIAFLTPGFDSGTYFQDPNSVFYNDASNNRADNNGHEWAFRGDAQYDLSEDGFLRQIRVGGRYSDRQQTVRTNDYNNWGSLSATWTDQGPSYGSTVPGAVTGAAFNDYFRNDAGTIPASLHIRDEILRDHDALMDLVRNVKDNTQAGQFSFVPLEDGHGCAKADLVNGYFCPNQIYNNSEKTWAAYVRADFGHDFSNGMRISGNVGVRYVHTQDDSEGAISYPQRNSVLPDAYPTFAEYCAAVSKPRGDGTVPDTAQIPLLCRPGATAEQQQAALAFANGASVPEVASQKFHNWLPALNVRFDLTSKLLLRFAASKAITRPDFASLRDYVSLSYNGSTGAFEARSSNAYLKPIRATQFDLTAEWYFAKVGSLTGAVFYKELKDVILENSGFIRTISNGGQSYDLALTGPANADGKSKIKGAEIAYQQTYDFLPGPLSGLGFQGTFTYIDAGTIQTSPPDYRAPSKELTGDGYQPPLDVQGLYDNLPLPLLSKYNFNATAFYDKYGLQARVAYNWRSKYLLTSRDCCFPFLPVYSKATGTMDASVFYTVDKHFKIGVEAINLLDTTTKTVTQVTGSGVTSPVRWFKTDRQYTLTVRTTF